MDKYYDFSDCKISRKQFGGSDRKESVFFEGNRYMLKFPDKITSDKRNELNSSYRNNVYSEYVSCHIIDALGYDVQVTLLGKYKGKKTVACKDFCIDGYELNEFDKYRSSFSIDFENTKYPDIYDVIDALENDHSNMGIDPSITIEQFWDIFALDTLLGNFDRHTGNWGYLYNDEIDDVKLAPIYDCGACLYPMLSDDGMIQVLQDEELIKKRIYEFPKPAFEMNGKRLTYHDFLQSDYAYKNIQLKKSITKLCDRYNSSIIKKVIQQTPHISDARADFYVKIIDERLRRLIYAYQIKETLI